VTSVAGDPALGDVEGDAVAEVVGAGELAPGSGVAPSLTGAVGVGDPGAEDAAEGEEVDEQAARASAAMEASTARRLISSAGGCPSSSLVTRIACSPCEPTTEARFQHQGTARRR
jgi:hypothetical protein